MRRLPAFLLIGLLMLAIGAGGFLGGWQASGLFLQALGLAAPMAAAPRVDPLVSAEPVAEPEAVDLALFWEAMALLESHFYGELPADDEVTYAAVRGVVQALDDQHTSFADPEQARMMEADLEGEFEGIGATVRIDENEELMIVSPIPNSPAEQAGLQAGDVVLLVDGEPVRGKPLIEAVSLIRGPQGSSVTLTIRREGERSNLEFEIVRDRIVVASVESRMIADPGQVPIGYLKLNDFGAHASEEVRKALEALRDQGAEHLILDLRANPGGYLSAAVEISSQFIGEGVILTEKGSQGRDNTHEAIPGGLALDLPLVVLIDAGSASASEIVAGAVQDAERGTLIGEKSFGKGSVQTTHDLSDQSSLRVTIARWFTPKGRAIHEVGIQPDIEVARSPDDVRAGRDPQLERAIEFIQTEQQAE